MGGQTGCVAMAYYTLCDANVAMGDTFAAARSLGKAATIYEKVGEKSKAGMCYLGMAKVELKAQDYAKMEDYIAKAKALAVGDAKVSGMAADMMVEVALSKDDIPGAFVAAKKVIGAYHEGGETKLEAKALLRLA